MVDDACLLFISHIKKCKKDIFVIIQCKLRSVIKFLTIILYLQYTIKVHLDIQSQKNRLKLFVQNLNYSNEFGAQILRPFVT
jgi:hypothetical protein